MWRAYIVCGPKRLVFVGALQSVRIHVHKMRYATWRSGYGVDVHEGKSWAGDVGSNPEAASKSLGKRSFTSPEVTAEQYDCTWFDHLGKLFGESHCVFGTGCGKCGFRHMIHLR